MYTSWLPFANINDHLPLHVSYVCCVYLLLGNTANIFLNSVHFGVWSFSSGHACVNIRDNNCEHFITGVCFVRSDIEAQILEIQGMKAALLEEGEQGVGLDSTGFFDQEIYGGSDSRFTGYVTSIAANEQEDV